MNRGISYTTIDTDVLDFMKYVCFGDITNPYETASRDAYRDMCRTLRLHGIPEEKRIELRSRVTAMLQHEIEQLISRGVKSQAEYDAWHYELCTRIRAIYREQGIVFYYGQAQKWLNMMMKYLYLIGECTFDELIQYLHVPVDNYLIDIAWKELGVARLQSSWSRWDDYTEQYNAYQKELRSKITACDPLRWEFRYWLKAAKQKTHTAML